MEEDRKQNIKANSVHVDANFETLLNAMNNKLDKDGSMLPTADISMSNHKLTGLAQPSNSGDATPKGYVDALVTELRNSIAEAKSSINTNLENLKAIYPIGSVYIGTQNDCPMKTLIPDSEWRLVSSGRALWTGNGSNGNNTIEAGLPNVAGTFNAATRGDFRLSGAIYDTGTQCSWFFEGGDWKEDSTRSRVFGLDASRSSSIYGKSSTVQPPAYIVNVWRRTA